MDYKSSIDGRWRLTVPAALVSHFGSVLFFKEIFLSDNRRMVQAHTASETILNDPDPWSVFEEKIDLTGGSGRVVIEKVLRDTDSFSSRKVKWKEVRMKDRVSHYELEPVLP